MGFFSSTSAKESYLGVDLGLSGIKIVELVNEKGRARLMTYAYTDISVTSASKPLSEDIERTSALLKKMIEKSRCTVKRAISALPLPSVFSSIVSVPASTEKEVKEAVRLQAKKLIPVPLEDMTLDFKTIDSTEVDGKKITRVLMTGAPRNLVNRYLEIFKSAGLELLSLETEAFATIRALIGKDRSNIMIIDIGSQRTNISVIERGIPFLSRSIATGGIAITQTISQTLGVPYEQAETMKRDIRMMQSFDAKGDVTPLLTTLLKPILDEIRYSFNLYQSQAEQGQSKRIDKIILTGGSALLPKLPEFLTQLLNVNAYLGDPWARVVYPQDLRPVLDEIGSRFTIAIGCAMRDIE